MNLADVVERFLDSDDVNREFGVGGRKTPFGKQRNRVSGSLQPGYPPESSSPESPPRFLLESSPEYPPRFLPESPPSRSEDFAIGDPQRSDSREMRWGILRVLQSHQQMRNSSGFEDFGLPSRSVARSRSDGLRTIRSDLPGTPLFKRERAPDYRIHQTLPFPGTPALP